MMFISIHCALGNLYAKLGSACIYLYQPINMPIALIVRPDMEELLDLKYQTYSTYHISGSVQVTINRYSPSTTYLVFMGAGLVAVVSPLGWQQLEIVFRKYLR